MLSLGFPRNRLWNGGLHEGIWLRSALGRHIYEEVKETRTGGERNWIEINASTAPWRPMEPRWSFRVVSHWQRSQSFEPRIDQLEISFLWGGGLTSEEAAPLGEGESSRGTQIGTLGGFTPSTWRNECLDPRGVTRAAHHITYYSPPLALFILLASQICWLHPGISPSRF